MDESQLYCPVCGRTLIAEGPEEHGLSDDDGLVFVHDDVPHDESDMQALFNGIN